MRETGLDVLSLMSDPTKPGLGFTGAAWRVDARLTAEDAAVEVGRRALNHIEACSRK